MGGVAGGRERGGGREGVRREGGDERGRGRGEEGGRWEGGKEGETTTGCGYTTLPFPISCE